jgi:hypothetical protein
MAHETQFPNVNLLAKQILEILGSQIEIECVFNLDGVLTTLRYCRLHVNNLDQIITVVKNWFENPRLNCS